LRVLAVEREPVSIAHLLAVLGPRHGRGVVLEAVEALRRRSLVERADAAGAAAITLQSVALEYVTDGLVERIADEIARGRPERIVELPLIQALAKDHVRQTQERLIGTPLVQRLNADVGRLGAEQLLMALLDGWRGRPDEEQGYGPGNVVGICVVWTCRAWRFARPIWPRSTRRTSVSWTPASRKLCWPKRFTFRPRSR